MGPLSIGKILIGCKASCRLFLVSSFSTAEQKLLIISPISPVLGTLCTGEVAFFINGDRELSDRLTICSLALPLYICFSAIRKGLGLSRGERGTLGRSSAILPSLEQGLLGGGEGKEGGGLAHAEVGADLL